MDPLNPGGIIPEEHRHWREMLGTFVLGRLEEGERVALQAHLDGCAECRAEVEELWPVAGALAEASPEHVGDAEAPPPGLIGGILVQVGRERQLRKRRQRRCRVGRSILAAVAATFVAIGFFALPPLISPGPPFERVAFSETAAGVDADANLVAHTSGTETKLVASGLRDGQTYKVALVGGDGTLVPSGAFIGTGESPVECNLNAPLLREDVAGLEVRSANGDLMLYAEVPEDAPSAGRESPLAELLPDPSWAPWGDAAQASVPELAVVPAVGGLTQEDAEEKLDAAGFGAAVLYEEGRPEEAGKVLSQSPEGGEKLSKGSGSS